MRGPADGLRQPNPRLLPICAATWSALDRHGREQAAVLPFGVEAIDRHLPHGGLPQGHLHEAIEGGAASQYAGLATLFVAGILARMQGPVLWCLRGRDLFAPALARVGLHPDRVIFCETWKDRDVLPAMEEGLKCAGLAGVVGEVSQAFPQRLAPPATLRGRKRRHGTRHSPLAQHNRKRSRWRAERGGDALARSALTLRPRAGSMVCRANTGSWICCGCAAANRIPGFWRHAMRRVISLYLPHWPSDRLRRAKQRRAATG